jgi:hypothetical protein
MFKNDLLIYIYPIVVILVIFYSNLKVETFNKNTLVVVGDHLLVYYNQNQLYEAKVSYSNT